MSEQLDYKGYMSGIHNAPKERGCTEFLALRHVERDKDHPYDKQVPTLSSEQDAYTVGWDLRGWFKPDAVISSPLARAVRTGRIVEAGIRGWQEYAPPPFRTDERLSDYSSDQRKLVAEGLREAKEYAMQNKIEPEEALWRTEAGIEAAKLKTGEALQVVNEYISGEQFLLAGLHGGTIDGMYYALSELLGEHVNIDTVKDGIFKYVQGWWARFGPDGELLEIRQIRRPDYCGVIELDMEFGGPDTPIHPWAP